MAQEDPFMALMVYRATPVAATGYSPSKPVMDRTTCTTMPTINRNLVPQWPDPEKKRLPNWVKERLIELYQTNKDTTEEESSDDGAERRFRIGKRNLGN
ncbi:hypothetical protein LSH36_308g02013 [Paralvinella palmiformis]|uniref:Uncharacterized protein n=1 Tax=Paralvinella palmiformis TaxID=53620 RepID=A0AAD9JH64_9ANNE|nr:hypothetical protein LSH36_308g02013 [Paralvinella palmiformis]